MHTYITLHYKTEHDMSLHYITKFTEQYKAVKLVAVLETKDARCWRRGPL